MEMIVPSTTRRWCAGDFIFFLLQVFQCIYTKVSQELSKKFLKTCLILNSGVLLVFCKEKFGASHSYGIKILVCNLDYFSMGVKETHMYTCEKLITRKFLRFLVSRCLRLVTKLASWTSRNSYLEHLETRLAFRSLKLSRIEDRVSRDCQLTFERYCMYWAYDFNMKRMELMVSSLVII